MNAPIETLESYWRQACSPKPLMVLGAGRWGRVWIDVLVNARGGSVNLCLVARSNYTDAVDWKRNRDDLRALHVTGSAMEAADFVKGLSAGSPSAIVASRPRDHARDVSLCIASGLPALVEKPFVSDHRRSKQLIAKAGAANVPLGIAVEFSLLPSLHFLVEELGKWEGDAKLYWCDLPAENRYGDVKRIHEELSVLDDILPHALSIFEVLHNQHVAGLDDGGWEILRARTDRTSRCAELSLAEGGRTYDLAASLNAPQRVRELRVECRDGRAFFLDFGGVRPRLEICGRSTEIPKQYLRLKSTLRLELGAWNTVLEGALVEPAIARTLEWQCEMFREMRRSVNQH